MLPRCWKRWVKRWAVSDPEISYRQFRSASIRCWRKSLSAANGARASAELCYGCLQSWARRCPGIFHPAAEVRQEDLRKRHVVFRQRKGLTSSLRAPQSPSEWPIICWSVAGSRPLSGTRRIARFRNGHVRPTVREEPGYDDAGGNVRRLIPRTRMGVFTLSWS